MPKTPKERAGNLSPNPLSFEEAVADILKVKPEPKATRQSMERKQEMGSLEKAATRKKRKQS